jgi:drug/metabolite transporter (DMT)-like permease
VGGLALAALTPGLDLQPLPLILGAATGTLYVGIYFLLDTALHRCGVAISMAVGRMSVLIPTLASVLIWRERPNAAQVAGIALAVVALPLLSAARPDPLRQTRGGRWSWVLLPIYFVLNGAGGLLFKTSSVIAPSARVEYVAALFCAAAVASLTVALRRQGIGSAREAGVGVLLGAANLVPNLAMYAALAYVPGMIAFPVSACGTLLLTTGAAWVIWRERYSARALVGLALALAALVLINVRS